MAEYLNGHRLLSAHQLRSANNRDEIKPEIISEETLKGVVTALFFSASWCEPCHQFLPVLQSFYKELKDTGSKFEIVFVSLDQTKESMMEYFTTEHGVWLALPFGDPIKDSMINKYHITAIPKLVVIRENGDIITLKGRKNVQDKGVICFKNWLSNSTPKEDHNKQTGEITNNASREITEKGIREATLNVISEEIDIEETKEEGSMNIADDLDSAFQSESQTSIQETGDLFVN